ncbi:hypothetical protein D3C72_1374610 [compost metagenome]
MIIIWVIFRKHQAAFAQVCLEHFWHIVRHFNVFLLSQHNISILLRDIASAAPAQRRIISIPELVIYGKGNAIQSLMTGAYITVPNCLEPKIREEIFFFTKVLPSAGHLSATNCSIIFCFQVDHIKLIVDPFGDIPELVKWHQFPITVRHCCSSCFKLLIVFSKREFINVLLQVLDHFKIRAVVLIIPDVSTIQAIPDALAKCLCCFIGRFFIQDHAFIIPYLCYQLFACSSELERIGFAFCNWH